MDFKTLGLEDFRDFGFRDKTQDTRRKTLDFKTLGLEDFGFRVKMQDTRRKTLTWGLEDFRTGGFYGILVLEKRFRIQDFRILKIQKAQNSQLKANS